MDNKPVLRIDKSGNKFWYLNGKSHRTDGPAIEYSNGHKEWYLDDKLHRVDGPAVIYPNGEKFWYSNGNRHREDGPAIELSNGDKLWHLNGDEYSFEEWLKLAPLSEREKVKLRLQHAE